MKSLNVHAESHCYPIIVGAGLLDSAEAVNLLKPLIDNRKCMVVSDSNVAPLYAALVSSALVKAGGHCAETAIIDAGESSKTLNTVEGLYHEAVARCLDRRAAVVALGGGVPGDIAGFVAATFMRGTRFIQVPTSLLAMVDSSVGGKVGVDLPEGKNLVGAFYQPEIVLIDLNFLKTLPKRELRCGLAEVVKYGVILDAELFSRLEDCTAGLLDYDLELYEEVVTQCCHLKAIIVGEDEREQSGRRAVLNYGHTFGHALEALGGYTALSHGEGVAIGMGMAADLAVTLGLAPAELPARQDALLSALGLATRYTVSSLAPAQVLQMMYRDKKVESGKLRLVLPRRIGEVELVADVDEEAVLKAIGGRCG
jgi:3-dehydroquinate synthase